MPTQLTWLGHNCWLLETPRQLVLLDPFLNDSPTAPCKAEELKPDVILVSHGHFDHIADAASIAKRCGATVVANFEVCTWLGRQGVEKLEEMNHGGRITLPLGRVTYTPAVHSSMLPDGSYGGNPGGFLIELEHANLYFACDTALFSDMQLIGRHRQFTPPSAAEAKRPRVIDLAVLPIGDRYTMGPDDSLEAIRLIDPHRVAPAHYNTWPPIAQDAAAWVARVRKETNAEPVTPEPGGVIGI